MVVNGIQHSVEVPEHLLNKVPVGMVAKWVQVENRLCDELEEWLIANMPDYMLSRMLPLPILFIHSDEDRALLKLRWGI